MQAPIRKKSTRYSAILSAFSLGLIAWGLMGSGGRAEAAIEKIEIAIVEFQPTGVGPGRSAEVTVRNTFCTESAEAVIRVLDARTGEVVGSTGPGFIDPDTGDIFTLFGPDGPSVRRNIVARVEIGCPRRSLNVVPPDTDGDIGAAASVEVVDREGRTIRRIPVASRARRTIRM